MPADNCPKGCEHETFHYCGEAGTHCDKHCACPCRPCVAARRDHRSPQSKNGGVILSGSVVGDPDTIKDMMR